MRLALSLLLLVLTGGVAEAQAFEVSQTDVRACYGATPVGVFFPDCLGAASNQCQNQPGGETTIGTTECIMSEYAAWDVLLNEAYQALRAEWRSREGGLGELSGEELNASLRDAQRAWIAFRDAECGLQYDRYRGGTIRSVVGANCLMVMTAQRAITLRDMAAP